MKRSRQEIITQILEICMNGASKTKIVYQANLNFKMVNPYLDLLITGRGRATSGRAAGSLEWPAKFLGSPGTRHKIKLVPGASAGHTSR
jgi:hypothetical protein